MTAKNTQLKLSVAFVIIGVLFLTLGWKLWDSPLWAGLFVGLGSSIIVWLLIEFFFGSFKNQHYDVTDEIYAIVKGERISSIEYPRGERNVSYYDKQFMISEEIFISGIATSEVLNSLNNQRSNLRKQIKNGLKVKILLLDPDSFVVAARQKYTTSEKFIKEDIIKYIDLIQTIKENLAAESNPKGELIIRTTKRPLYTSIFASRKDFGSEGKHGILLINPIFSHQRGDASIQFEISNPRNGKLLDIYNAYINCFEDNFREVDETSTICYWDSRGLNV